MTWGGTNFFFIKIVTLKTGDMAQKVFFGDFWTHWRQVTGPLCQKKSFKKKIKSCAMGGCIKVVYKKNWFPTEKKSCLQVLHLAVNHSLAQIIFLFEKRGFF
jgi:hypothetical protein